MKKLRTTVKAGIIGGLLVIGLVGGLLAQTTKVTPVATFSCTNQFASALAATGVFTCSSIGNNTVSNAMLAQGGANTMKGNWTGSTANEADNAMPSCSDSSGNHLNYVSGTGVTCGTSVDLGPHVWTGLQTFAAANGASNPQSGSTYTLVASDCGKTVIDTYNGGDQTITIDASIVPASGTVCAIGVMSTVAHKALVNGSAVSPATLVSANSWVGTSGVAGAAISLLLTTVGGTPTAYILGGNGA